MWKNIFEKKRLSPLGHLINQCNYNLICLLGLGAAWPSTVFSESVYIMFWVTKYLVYMFKRWVMGLLIVWKKQLWSDINSSKSKYGKWSQNNWHMIEFTTERGYCQVELNNLCLKTPLSIWRYVLFKIRLYS